MSSAIRAQSVTRIYSYDIQLNKLSMKKVCFSLNLECCVEYTLIVPNFKNFKEKKMVFLNTKCHVVQLTVA